MKPTKRILFAVKNPDASRQPGVDKAIHIAREFDATLELFHAISSPVFLEVQPLRGSSLAELRLEALALRGKKLEKLAARARRRGVATRAVIEWDYPPHEAIVRRAEASGADLIIAECHQGKRLRPWLMRLTDWELLRTSSLPVLLLKNEKRWRDPVILAAVDPSHARDKPARLDADILEYGTGVARALGGTLDVVHANFPSPYSVLGADPLMGGSLTSQAYEVLQAAGRKRFEKFATRAGIARTSRHLIDSDPVFAIPHVARKLGADLLIMGAVSRSGMKRIFIGNTAEKLLESLPCDVLVIKPSRFRSRIARKPRGMRVVAPVPLVPIAA